MRCVDAVRAFFLSSSSFPSSSLSRLHDSKERMRAKRRVVKLLSEIWNLCLQKSLVGVHSFCISHHECDHYSRKKKRREITTTTTTLCRREKWSLFSRKSRRRLLVVNRRPLLNGKTKTPLLKERERERKVRTPFLEQKKRVKKTKKKEKKNAFERRRRLFLRPVLKSAQYDTLNYKTPLKY